MYKRSFIIKSLPPITLDTFEHHSIIEYKTNYISLIGIDDNYYLKKDNDKQLKIKKNFFDFLKADAIEEISKDVYTIPLSAALDIILEIYKKDDTEITIANINFETLEESLNFDLSKFFFEEIDQNKVKKLTVKKNFDI